MLHSPGCAGVQGVWSAARQLRLFSTAGSRCGCFAHAEENSSSVLYCFLLRRRPFSTTRQWAVLSICFCEKSPSQSSSWWCKLKSFLLWSWGWEGLSLTLLGVKSNRAFLSALAVRTGWVRHLPSNSGTQDSLLLHGFSLISFINLLTTLPSSLLYMKHFLYKRTKGTRSCFFLPQPE